MDVQAMRFNMAARGVAVWNACCVHPHSLSLVLGSEFAAVRRVRLEEAGILHCWMSLRCCS